MSTRAPVVDAGPDPDPALLPEQRLIYTIRFSVVADRVLVLTILTDA